MITYRQGNLLESGLDAIAHGCNCEGIMNAGIARDLKNKFPQMYREYNSLCSAHLAKPGEYHIYSSQNSPHIINLFTQKTIEEGAKIEYIEDSLALLASKLPELKNKDVDIKSLGMPRLGCGLGRLNWSQVRPVIERNLGNLDIEVIVYSL